MVSVHILKSEGRSVGTFLSMINLGKSLVAIITTTICSQHCTANSGKKLYPALTPQFLGIHHHSNQDRLHILHKRVEHITSEVGSGSVQRLLMFADCCSGMFWIQAQAIKSMVLGLLGIPSFSSLAFCPLVWHSGSLPPLDGCSARS